MSDGKQWTRRKWVRACAGTAGLTIAAGCLGDGDSEGSLAGNGETEATGNDETATSETGNDAVLDRLPGWPMYAVDPLGTGHHPTTTGPTGDVHERWRFEYDSSIRAPPALVDGVVYTGAGDGAAWAIDAADGSVLWDAETDRVDHTPLVLDDTVYVQGSTKLHAVDRETGDIRWVDEHRGSIDRPVPYESGVLVAMMHGSGPKMLLYEPSSDTPEVLYEFQEVSPGRVSEEFVLAGNTVYFCHDRTLVAIDLNEGEQAWTWDHPEDHLMYYGLASDGDAIYTVSNANGPDVANCIALDAETGDHRWTHTTEVPGGLDQAPAVADGTVYVSHSETLAIDAETGDELWRVDTPGYTKPAIVDGVVYGHDSDGGVALDAETGDPLWSHALPSGQSQVPQPVVHDGLALLTQAESGVVVALEDT